MNRKTILMLVLVSTVSVISTAFVVNSINQNNSSDSNNSEGCNEYRYSRLTRYYDLTIDSEGNYTVLVPVVLDNWGISFMMNNLSLEEGNASFEIVNSTYGPALRVNGSGKAVLHSEMCVKTLWRDRTYYPIDAELCNGRPIDVYSLIITPSMTNYSSLKLENGTYVASGIGYNSTRPDFRNSRIWKNGIESRWIYLPLSPIQYSFVYTDSKNPVNITLELSDDLGYSESWTISYTFTENGWHYVKVNAKEGPAP